MATEQKLANRKRLIEALRAEMPPNFTWDFAKVFSRDEHCGTIGCAVGLGRVMGLFESNSTLEAGERVGLDREDANACFRPTDEWDDEAEDYITDGYGVAWHEVTPQMVADQLEALAD